MFRNKKELQRYMVAFSVTVMSTQYLSPRAAAQDIGQNLNLGSATASMTAQNKNAVNIQVGGSVANGTVSGGAQMTVAPGQLVTAAQYTAAMQAIQGGGQSLLVNAQGAAAGGSANLSATQVTNLAGLVVPAGVSVNAIGYSQLNPLNVAGQVNILGSLYALQNAPNVMAALNMGSLNVASGGLLSGQLPGGLNLAGLFSSAGMQLNVAGNVVNSGTISTPGALSVIAGGNITNQSVNNVQAVMSAQNVNLVTGTGSFINSGLIQAVNTLSLNTLSQSTNLVVNNAGGVLQAVGGLNPATGLFESGVINVRQDGADLESANVTISGGTLDAAGGVDVFGKNMEVHVDEIKGSISNTGSVAHVSVSQGELSLGRQVLSGDPTYYNSAGDVHISDLVTVNGDLAIVASGDIVLDNPVVAISTTSGSDSIFMSAGYNFTVAPSDDSKLVYPAEDPGDSTNTLTFDGTSNAGKSINIVGNQLNVTTSGAGTVTMLATGSINLGPGGAINSDNGAVLLIAGADILGSGASINTTGGSVLVASGTPSSLSGTTILDGSVSALPTLQSTDSGMVQAPAITSSLGAPVSVSTNGLMVLNGNISGGGTVNVLAGTGLDAQGFSVQSTGDLTITPGTGSLLALGDTSAQGILYIGTTDGSTTSNTGISLQGSVASIGGSSDSITILSNGTILGGNFISTDGSLEIRSTADAVLLAGNDLTAGGAGSSLIISSAGAVDTGSVLNAGGSVDIQTSDNTATIKTGFISTSNSSGGSVSITGAKTISVSGSIDASGISSDGGLVTLSAVGSINAGAISTSGNGGDGGDITVASSASSVILGAINAGGSGAGNSGGIVDISAGGGSIQVGGGIDNFSDGGTAGSVTLFTSQGLEINGSTPGLGVISGTITSSGFVSITAGGTVQLSGTGDAITGSSIGITTPANIQANIAGGGGLNAAQLALVSTGGSVGTIAIPITISQDGAVVAGSAGNGVFSVNNSAGSMTVDGATAGTITASGITAAADIFVGTAAGGTLTVLAPITAGPGSTITLNTDELVLTGGGVVDNSGGTVQIAPANVNSDIIVGGSAVGTYLTDAQLADIIAETLIVGSNALQGKILLGNNLDVGVADAGTQAGSYNLSLLTSGAIDTLGFSISGGNNNISLSSNKSTISSDAITTTAGSISLSAGAGVTLNDNLLAGDGDITVSGQNGVTLNGTLQTTGTGSISVLSTSGDITGNNQTINSGGSATVDPGSGAVLSLGLVQAVEDILVGTSDGINSGASGVQSSVLDNSIGSGPVVVLTKTGNITNAQALSADGITIKNLGSGTILTGSLDNTAGAGDIFVSANSGNVTTGNTKSNGDITVQSQGAGAVVTGNLDNSGGAGDITVKSAAGSVNVGATTGSGNITIESQGAATVTTASLDNSGGTGDITVKSAAGAVNVASADASGNIVVRSQGSGTVVTGTLDNSGGSGEITVDSSGDVTVGGASSTNNISIKSLGAGTVNTTGLLDNSAGAGNITVDSAGGKVNVAAISGSADIKIGNLASGTDINLNGSISNASGSGEISILSGKGTIDGTQSVTSSGNLKVEAKTKDIGATTPLGNLTAGGAGSTLVVEATAGALVVGALTNDEPSLGAGAGSITVHAKNAAIVQGSISAQGEDGGEIDMSSDTDFISVDGSINNTAGTGTAGGITLSPGKASIPLRINFGLAGANTIKGSLTSSGAITLNTLPTQNVTITGTGTAISTPDVTTITTDKLSVNATATINSGSIVINGDGTGTEMEVVNNGTLIATNGDILVNPVAGKDIRISSTTLAGGVWQVGDGSTINIETIDTPTVHPSMTLDGKQTFNLGSGAGPIGAFANFFTQKTVTITPGTQYEFPINHSHVTVLGSSLVGNPSQFDIFKPPNNQSTFNLIIGSGTIANSGGAIDLSTLTNLTFNGAIAMLAATDIIDGGSTLTIQANGFPVTLIAGYNFTPPTVGVQGPDGQAYFLTGATTGGSILIPNVDIDTSSATKGGDVLLVANGGTALGSGAVQVNNIDTQGPTSSGTVTIIGNGVSANDITTSSLGTAGAVTINSASSASFTPGLTVQGTVSGGTFTPGTQAGAVSLGNVDVGTAALTVTGGSIASAGIFTAKTMVLGASTGDIGPLTTVTGILTANADGFVDITNTGALQLNGSSGDNFFSLVNDADITLAGPLTGGDITLDVGTSGDLILNANVTATGLFTGIGNEITGTGTLTAADLDLTANAGNIGPFTTAVNNSMLLSASGVAGASIDLTNTGNIASLIVSTVGSSGTFSLDNTGDVTLGDVLFAPNGVTLTLAPGFTLTDNGNQIQANGPIDITTDSLNLTASPDAGATGTIGIQPATGSRTITVGGIAANSLNISESVLAGMVADQVFIGSAAGSGAINVVSDLDLSSAGYNQITFTTGSGDFMSSGFDIDTSPNLTIQSTSGFAQLGGITGSAPNTIKVQAADITIDGAIGSNVSEVQLIGDLGVFANSTSVITSNKLIITSTNGSVGTSTDVLNTVVDGDIILNGASPTAGFFFSNTGNVDLNVDVAGTFNLQNNGNVTLSSGLFALAGITVGLSSGNTLDLGVDGFKTTNAPMQITTDFISFGTSPSSFDAGTGAITILPADSSQGINLGTASGGLDFTKADLESITAGSLTIGKSGTGGTTGGIQVGGPLAISIGYNLNLLQGTNGSFTADDTIDISGGGNFSLFMDSGNIDTFLISNAADNGAVSLQTQGNITFQGAITQSQLENSAHSITILAGTGSLIGLPALTGQTVTPRRNLNQDGGTFVIGGGTGLPTGLTIDARGLGVSGSGGTAGYLRAATSAFTPTSLDIALLIGGANQGTAILSNGGDLTIDQSAGNTSIVTNNQGNGASFILSAGTQGTGNLLVTGSLGLNASANFGGTKGGNIVLNSNTTNSFLMNSSTTKNGVRGTIQAAGSVENGSLTITNRAGGISNASQALTAFKSITFDTTGASGTKGLITVSKALGSSGVNGTQSISLTAGGTAAVSTGAIVLSTVPGGTVALKGGANITSTVDTTNLSANTSGKSAVTLTNKSTGAMNLLSSSTLGALTLTSAGSSITTTGDISAGTTLTMKSTNANGAIVLNSNVTVGVIGTGTGTVTLTATGSGAITGTGIVSAKTVTLTAGKNPGNTIGTALQPLQLKAVSVSTSSTGLLNLANGGFGTQTFTVKSAKTTGNPVTVTSTTPMVFTPSLTGITSAVLSSAGNLTVNGSLGSVAANTTSIVLASGGNISGSGTMTTNGGGSFVVMQTFAATSAVGTSTVPVKVNTPSVSVVPSQPTSGVINLSSTGKNPINVSNLTSTGAVLFKGAGNANFGSVSGSAVTLKLVGVNNFSGGVAATGGALALTQTGAGTATSITGAISSTSTLGITTAGPFSAGSTINSAGNMTLTTGGATTVTGNATAGGTLTYKQNVVGVSQLNGLQGSSVTVTEKPALASTSTFGDINATTGAVKITQSGNIANTTLTSFNGSITGQSITITTSGGTSFAANKNVTATNGAIAVTSSAGLLQVGNGANFTSNSTGTTAKITILEKANTSNLEGITIGNGAQLNTNAGGTKSGTVGQISVVVGASVPAKVAGTQPAFTNVTNGPDPAKNTVFWGANSSNVLTTAPVNNFTIVGNTAIQFSAGTVAPIRINGSTTWVADPPVASPAAMANPLLAPSSTGSVNNVNNGSANNAAVQFSNSAAMQSANTVSSALQNPVSIPLTNTGSTAVFNTASLPVSGFTSTKVPSMEARSAQSQGAASLGALASSRLRSEAPGFLQGAISEFNSSDTIEAEFASDRSFGFNTPSSKNFVSMNSGSTVFAPFVDTVVETPFGKIEIAARSIAVVMVSHNSTAVYNIDDDRRDAVRVISNNHKFPVAPGRHLTVAPAGVRGFDLVNPVESIGYRAINEKDVAGMKVFHAEFSVPSAVAAIKPLKQLFSSKHPEAIKLSRHMAKTIAAMLQMNKTAERYQQVMHPRMSASALK